MTNNILHLSGVDPDGFLCAVVRGGISGVKMRQDGVNMMESVAGPSWRSSRLMLDFSHCDFIDSNGMGWLVEANKLFNEGGGMLVMHSLTVNVARAFNMTRLDRVFSLAPDETAAAALLRKP